jgi:hypothetical protein
MTAPYPSEKECFKCHMVLPLDQFYRHKYMRDGHLNKCITCTKADVARRYHSEWHKVAAYERVRTATPERRAAVARYQKTTRTRHPEKARAWAMVTNAIRDGVLVRQPCRCCGTTEAVQAHHHDYSKPLDVDWLCFRCHREHGHGQRTAASRVPA